MRRRYFLLFIVMMFIGIGSGLLPFAVNAVESDGLSEKEARAYANEHNTWVLCYQQGSRTSNFNQYDATDDRLYFSYSKHDCVDVYNMQGVFLYSIIFPERQNGSVSVRCEDDWVYISTKDNILYIFSGAEEVEHMDYDAAADKGYDFFWFYENEPHITVDGKGISWFGEAGDVVREIPTPSVIRETIPLPDDAATAIPIICAALFFVVLAMQALPWIRASIRRKTRA